MRLRKALNNNVALVLDSGGEEAVVMGRGVAFDLKPGMSIDPNRVEKRFALDRKRGRTLTICFSESRRMTLNWPAI